MTQATRRVLIVHASQSGGALRMAEAVERGLETDPPIEVRRMHGTQAELADLRGYPITTGLRLGIFGRKRAP